MSAREFSERPSEVPEESEPWLAQAEQDRREWVVHWLSRPTIPVQVYRWPEGFAGRPFVIPIRNLGESKKHSTELSERDPFETIRKEVDDIEANASADPVDAVKRLQSLWSKLETEVARVESRTRLLLMRVSKDKLPRVDPDVTVDVQAPERTKEAIRRVVGAVLASSDKFRHAEPVLDYRSDSGVAEVYWPELGQKWLIEPSSLPWPGIKVRHYRSTSTGTVHSTCLHNAYSFLDEVEASE